ncbi:hypothetical protein BU25DRAFT_456053 [Macroventuria anomochaeta]|uniref:Uncharacterized protein n=1 Tax=Macroventuria anomochaeta TaxID=301207 RepID=A0ACB6S831_9PLEO|nr:uncharacterized protein BU25DRAFT_456053 [Macroventuria anomochaeta]KAF2630296.1 hypothetical protein BU25DRAFT_456053 [Macroventuria anomochaeta]
MTRPESSATDVHAGINAVFQLDIACGRVSELVAAAASLPNKPATPGGASMPRLSRDGRTLAFVRRSDDREVLAWKDMRSGTVHHAWGGLEYDLSTIPAFVGTYPNYGWSRNDSIIVLWSQGQIWWVDLVLNEQGERVAERTPSVLKFEAQVEMKLTKTRYSETRIRKEELAFHRRIRALRGLRSDFTGHRVVFEAAGDNYLVDPVTAAVLAIPKPLSEKSCYAPSFVKDSVLFL